MCPLLIVSQSDCLIQVVDTNPHTNWQKVQIKISWLLIWIYTACKDRAYLGSAGLGLISALFQQQNGFRTKHQQLQQKYLLMLFLFFFSNILNSLQGPAVQSFVSLTSSLRVISLTVLPDSIYNILIFFAEKMWVAFALQKLLTFFQQKISAFLRITRCKF